MLATCPVCGLTKIPVVDGRLAAHAWHRGRYVPGPLDAEGFRMPGEFVGGCQHRDPAEVDARDDVARSAGALAALSDTQPRWVRCYVCGDEWHARDDGTPETHADHGVGVCLGSGRHDPATLRQPDPVPGGVPTLPVVRALYGQSHPAVVRAVEARAEVGERTYGVRGLHTPDGRNHGIDRYQEGLDNVAYSPAWAMGIDRTAAEWQAAGDVRAVELSAISREVWALADRDVREAEVVRRLLERLRALGVG